MRIYSIKHKESGEIIYIGSTKYALSDRRARHRYDYDTDPSPVHLYMAENGGWDAFEFETKSEHTDITRLELYAIEKQLIADHAPVGNTHKLLLLSPEERKEADRLRYHKNKLPQLLRQAIRYQCECGSNIRKGDVSHHIKTQKHQAWASSVSSS